MLGDAESDGAAPRAAGGVALAMLPPVLGGGFTDRRAALGSGARAG